MKIFVITARVGVLQKPEWLDAFRAKYDEDFECHITLKQPCFVEDSDVPTIKERLANLFLQKNSNSEIKLKFDELITDRDAPHGKCIMVASRGEGSLHELQKKVVAALPEFVHYRSPESKDWEEHFLPHITIARHLTPEQHEEALQYLQSGVTIDATISQVMLVVVNIFGPEEASLPENQTVYSL